MNKNNLDDLDALYFFDKIEMKNKRSNSQTVPLIKIGKDGDVEKSSIQTNTKADEYNISHNNLEL